MNRDTTSDGLAPLSPEEVVRTVFELVATGHHDEVAAFVDADDLKVLRRDAERAAQAPAPALMTAEDYMELEPGLPRAVAEYYAARDQAKGWHLDSVLSQTFARVETAADLEGLDTAQLLGRWLEARDPVAMIPRFAAKRRVRSPVDLDYFREHRAVVGAVREEDDTAPVLYARDSRPPRPTFSRSCASPRCAARPRGGGCDSVRTDVWARRHGPSASIRTRRRSSVRTADDIRHPPIPATPSAKWR